MTTVNPGVLRDTTPDTTRNVLQIGVGTVDVRSPVFVGGGVNIVGLTEVRDVTGDPLFSGVSFFTTTVLSVGTQTWSWG